MADRVSTAVPPDIEASMARNRQRLKETDFVLDFVEKSRAAREPHVRIWREVLDNYMVAPVHQEP